MSVNDILVESEDRPSYVRFEVRAVKDPQASLKAGHYVSMDEDWALISALGSTDVVPKKAEKWFDIVETNVKRGREPAKHLDMYREIYDRWKRGLEAPVNGTSVKDWNTLSPAQCDNLISVGLRTIEDVAQAPDDAMRKYGLGMQDLKQRANAWLQAAKDHGPLIEEVAQLKNQNKQLEGTINSLQEQIKRFEIRMDAQDDENPSDPFNTGYIAKKLTEDITETMRKAESGEWKPGQVIPPSEVKTIIERYEDKFGKKPDGRWTDATILKKLQE